MSEFGLYRVSGKRDYRGHEPGSEFEARLDRNAVGRAVQRGDIELLAYVIPELQPGSFIFPEGWLADDQRGRPPRPERASLIEGSS